MHDRGPFPLSNEFALIALIAKEKEHKMFSHNYENVNLNPPKKNEYRTFTSCTGYNCTSIGHGRVHLLVRGGGGGGVGVLVLLVLLTFGWGCVVQNRESPDFRSPEVGRYAL